MCFQAEEMILEIKTAFKANLPNLKWMDAETRLAAIEKVGLAQTYFIPIEKRCYSKKYAIPFTRELLIRRGNCPV